MAPATETTGPQPVIERLRHELKRRELTVAAVQRLSPHMIRVTLTGDDLADFVSGAPDDHIKIFFPQGDGEPARRDYTPRRFSQADRSLVVDFVDHEGGPAADWARAAQPGDRISIGGPRGSQIIGGDIRGWVLIGDETALPAIGRRIEEMAPGLPVTAILAVAAAAEEQPFATKAALTARWVHRPAAAATDPAPLLAALREVDLPPQTFVWIGAEAGVARALRAHLLEERGFPRGWLKASGYWLKGQADAAIKNFDEVA